MWARFPAAIKVDDPFSSAEIWQFLPVEELVYRLKHEFGRVFLVWSFLGLLIKKAEKVSAIFSLQKIMLVFSKNQWAT